MATNACQIKCINKLPRNDPYRITHGGGVDASAWKLTLDEAIDGIENKDLALLGQRRRQERLGRNRNRTERKEVSQGGSGSPRTE